MEILGIPQNTFIIKIYYTKYYSKKTLSVEDAVHSLYFADDYATVEIDH